MVEVGVMVQALSYTDSHCVESAIRKWAWFGLQALLLSGISNLLSAKKCHVRDFQLTLHLLGTTNLSSTIVIYVKSFSYFFFCFYFQALRANVYY